MISQKNTCTHDELFWLVRDPKGSAKVTHWVCKKCSIIFKLIPCFSNADSFYDGVKYES